MTHSPVRLTTCLADSDDLSFHNHHDHHNHHMVPHQWAHIPLIRRSRSAGGPPNENVTLIFNPSSRSPSRHRSHHQWRHSHSHSHSRSRSPVRIIDVHGVPERGRERNREPPNVSVVNVVEDRQTVREPRFRSPDSYYSHHSPSRRQSYHDYHHDGLHNQVCSRNDATAKAYVITNDGHWDPGAGPWQTPGYRYFLPRSGPSRHEIKTEIERDEYVRGKFVDMEIAKFEKRMKDMEIAKDAAIKDYQVKSDKGEKDREDAGDRAVRKYKTDEENKKEAGKEAVTKYKTDEEGKKEAGKEAVAKYKRDEDDKKEWEKQAVAKYKREEDEKKSERERIKVELRSEADKKKQEEDDLKKKWKVESEKKKLKEEKEKKEKDEKIEQDMHHRLAKFGFQDNQIDVMLKPEKAQDLLPLGPTPMSRMRNGYGYAGLGYPNRPTFVTVTKDKVEIASLDYFGLPWRYDPYDSNLIIIERDRHSYDIDEVFRHTWYLRRRKFLEPNLICMGPPGRRRRPDYWEIVRHHPRKGGSSRMSAPRFWLST